MLWPVVFLMLLTIFPMLSADAIARDRQFGVLDLLTVTPLASATYLLGKVVALFALSFIAMSGVMLALGVLWWRLMGPFDLATYVSLWTSSLLPMSLVNPVLSLLLASRAQNRRTALAIGFLFGLASLVLLGTSSALLQSQIGSFDYFNPAHPLVFIHDITALMQGGAYDFIASKDIVLTWLASGVDLLLLGGAAWWFHQRQMARA